MRVKPSTSLPVGAIWLAQMVPRLASRVAKLCTGRRSGVFFVVTFFRAEEERCAGAIGLVRVGSAASLSSSRKSIGESARSMWKVT